MRWQSALVAVIALGSISLRAQTIAVPDAPMPQNVPVAPMPVPGAGSLRGMSGVSADDRSVCDGPATGIYAPGRNGVPAGQVGPANAYMKNAFALVWKEWSKSPKPAGAEPARVVRLRFVIYPDGTYSKPEVTDRSSDAGDDERALAAVKSVGSFAPLPEGFWKPVVACMRLGYDGL